MQRLVKHFISACQPPDQCSRRPSQPQPSWLGRLPRQPRGTQIWGGEVCQEWEAELSDLRLQRSPLPPAHRKLFVLL